MKFLAGATIVLAIPTMISSFLGMNISLGDFAKEDYAFVIVCVFSFLLAVFVAYLLKKKDML